MSECRIAEENKITCMNKGGHLYDRATLYSCKTGNVLIHGQYKEAREENRKEGKKENNLNRANNPPVILLNENTPHTQGRRDEQLQSLTLLLCLSKHESPYAGFSSLDGMQNSLIRWPINASHLAFQQRNSHLF